MERSGIIEKSPALQAATAFAMLGFWIEKRRGKPRRFLFCLLVLPPAGNAHAEGIGAGVDGDGAADLQQLHLAGAGGILGAEGGAGLHPEPLALVGIVAVAHRDAVVVGRAVVFGQIGHQ